MIGREPELAELARLGAGLREGRGGCALVTGEAGIGKTRLVSHALALAGIPAYSGAARASVAEPYGPLTEVLRQGLRATRDLSGALGPLAPYLAPLLPEIGVTAQDGGEATLVEAVLRALSELGARGPAAVVLDDLHWA